jgi:hypothetical protein
MKIDNRLAARTIGGGRTAAKPPAFLVVKAACAARKIGSGAVDISPKTRFIQQLTRTAF